MKKVAVLGSTGSIGTQTLDVVRANDDLEVSWSCSRQQCRNAGEADT